MAGAHRRTGVARGGDDPVQVSVLAQQRGSGLRADPRDARQSVRGVPDEHGVVRVRPRVVARRQVEALGHDPRGVREPLLHPGPHVHDGGRRRGQLEQVAVARDDQHLAIASGQRCQHVIGLRVLRPGLGEARGAEDLADRADLRGQGFGGVLLAVVTHPVRLVRRQQLHPPVRAPLPVQGGHQARRRVLLDQHGDHVAEPAHRVGRGAVGPGDLLGHGVERAEPQAGAVENHERALGHRASLWVGDHAGQGSCRPGVLLIAGHERPLPARLVSRGPARRAPSVGA